MKIAWLINLYPPYVMGGNEMVAKDVILALRARGHEVYLLTGRGKHLPQDPYHLSPLNLDLDLMAERFFGTRTPSLHESLQWYLFDPYTYRTTVQALLRIKPDLIIVDNFSLVSVAPLLAAVRAKSPVIVQANDKWLIYGLKTAGGPGLWHCPRAQRPWIVAAQRLLQPMFSTIARHVHVIVNSHFMKDTYIRAGFKEEHLQVVYLSIDVDMFWPDTDRSRIAAPVRLMFAGQLWAGKGPQIAIKALAELKKQSPEMNFILELYGKGDPGFRNYLDKLALQLDVSDSIRYCGFVPQTELAEALRTHDIFLFTSIWDEPFSLTLLQAMSCGIPVISTVAGGNAEAIENEYSGLLVSPGDPVVLAQAILKLVQDPALRSRLSMQASAAVRERWSLRQYVDTLEMTYQAYIKER